MMKGESQVQADEEQAFTRFVKETEPRLSYALAAAYGPEVGADATADALAYAWENWEKVRGMGRIHSERQRQRFPSQCRLVHRDRRLHRRRG